MKGMLPYNPTGPPHGGPTARAQARANATARLGSKLREGARVVASALSFDGLRKMVACDGIEAVAKTVLTGPQATAGARPPPPLQHDVASRGVRRTEISAPPSRRATQPAPVFAKASWRDVAQRDAAKIAAKTKANAEAEEKKKAEVEAAEKAAAERAAAEKAARKAAAERAAAASKQAAAKAAAEGAANSPPAAQAFAPAWVVPSAALRWERELGRGGFGVVYEVNPDHNPHPEP